MKSAGILVILITIAGLIALSFKMSFANFIGLVGNICWIFTASCLLLMLGNWLLSQQQSTKASSRQSGSRKLAPRKRI